MQNSARRMQTLIEDLLDYYSTSTQERVFEKYHIKKIVYDVKEEINDEIIQKMQLLKLMVNAALR